MELWHYWWGKSQSPSLLPLQAGTFIRVGGRNQPCSIFLINSIYYKTILCLRLGNVQAIDSKKSKRLNLREVMANYVHFLRFSRHMSLN